MNRRILIIDDNQDIHEDFQKILGGRGNEDASFQNARSAFLGAVKAPVGTGPRFEVSGSLQGQEGLRALQLARSENRPYALAFVDVRMPPGWDGIETIQRLWSEDDDLQVVICTAYADYSFEEIVQALGASDRLLILKKPFDPVEVRQLAVALTEKWNLIQRDRQRMEELRRAEQEAREYAAALERSNRALEDANRQAQAASKAKSEFLANMSHEIRTPMTGLLGYGELICDGSIPLEDRLRYGEIIRKSGNHLLTVLNDILDISKIESGRMELNSREVEPTEIVREVFTIMRTQAEEKGIGIAVDWAAPIPRVIQSDPQRLRQVLLNLVGNAIKFTERGEVKLRVGTEQEGENAFLRFDVIDTGIGVDAKHLPTLFEAFSQADTSSTREAGGTGLGLAISKRLALMLNGSILVESKVGKGSTFTLRLRLDPLDTYELFQPAEKEGRRTRAAAPVEEPLEALVLLVEDGAVNQLLISTVLGKAGAEVQVADDGRAGCRMVREARASGRPFDLILMDMQMPVMDGYQASAALRREGIETPIVALTAHAMAGDREKCLAAGCTDYATKPIDRLALLALCRRLLKLEGTHPPMPGVRANALPPAAERRG
jgi:two-component system, sensor histidine kinase and response regulator